MAMTLRLTDEQDRALTLLAQANGTSKHEAVVRAIIREAARTIQDAHVAQLARDVLDSRTVLEARIRDA